MEYLSAQHLMFQICMRDWGRYIVKTDNHKSEVAIGDGEGEVNRKQDVFMKFLDEGGKFKKAFNEDMEGLISLYEAAHLGVNNEEIMSQALDYSKEQLKKSMNGCLKSQYHMLKEAENALELPRHMRMVVEDIGTG
ncbi:Selinene synthase [Acorus calamus]|uniref:Selinene synthase n=1 Tax=Acorus calamus TaxID=4465 RepID=A0AAV9DYR6_ACOCL|nr:Selinene synthase [Acorus calamus]